MAEHLSTELVVDALKMALWRRKPGAGPIHHTDLGSRYTALSFEKRLEEVGIKPRREGPDRRSTTRWPSRSSQPWKAELVNRCRFPTRETVRRTAIIKYAEGSRGRVRRHSSRVGLREPGRPRSD